MSREGFTVVFVLWFLAILSWFVIPGIVHDLIGWDWLYAVAGGLTVFAFIGTIIVKIGEEINSTR